MKLLKEYIRTCLLENDRSEWKPMKVRPAEGAEWAQEQWGEGPFLRFGRWSKHSKIYHGWRTGDEYTHETGISVFPAKFENNTWNIDCKNQTMACKDTASSAYSRLIWRKTEVFLVKGTIVGIGEDGEPLLGDDITLIKKLDCKEVNFPRNHYGHTPEDCDEDKEAELAALRGKK